MPEILRKMPRDLEELKEKLLQKSALKTSALKTLQKARRKLSYEKAKAKHHHKEYRQVYRTDNLDGKGSLK